MTRTLRETSILIRRPIAWLSRIAVLTRPTMVGPRFNLKLAKTSASLLSTPMPFVFGVFAASSPDRLLDALRRIRLLYLKRCLITMLCERTCFNTWSSLSKSLIVALITLLSNAWRRRAWRARTYVLSRACVLISEHFTNFHLWPLALLNWYASVFPILMGSFWDLAPLSLEFYSDIGCTARFYFSLISYNVFGDQYLDSKARYHSVRFYTLQHPIYILL